MLVTQCDICKKKIGYKEIIRVQASGMNFSSFEFGNKCSKSIIKFLASKKLIENEKSNKKTK